MDKSYKYCSQILQHKVMAATAIDNPEVAEADMASMGYVSELAKSLKLSVSEIRTQISSWSSKINTETQ